MNRASLQLSVATLALAGLFLFVTSAFAARPIVKHELVVTLHPDAQRLTGTDTLRLNPDGAPHLLFTLATDASINWVFVDGKGTAFAFEDGQLRIPVPQNTGPGEIAVSVSYEALFRDSVPKDPVHTEDPSYGVTGVISAQGTLLLPGAGWYPYLEGSRSAFLLRVHTPSGYEAVTSGKRLARNAKAGIATSVWKITRASGGLALSAGRYAVRERLVRGIPVYTYFFAEDDRLAGQYLEATATFLDLYSDLLGPYPFEKFAVVENCFPTGYGFPSYTLLGKTVIRLPFIVDTSLGHEIAHAWWGNGVLVDHEGGNWSEGLTTYVADHLFKERSSAQEGRAYRLKILRDYATLVPPGEDFPLQAFTHRFNPLTRAVGYGKGAMVFHMARRLVGDETFWAGLREVFRKRCFKKTSWDHFSAALSRGSGRDLSPFFSQWVARSGAPKLALVDVNAKKAGPGWRVTGCLTQDTPYYSLEIPLRLETHGPSIQDKLSLTGREAFFMLDSKSRPQRLVVDPGVDVFRRLDPVEIPPTINGIKGSKTLVAVLARSLPAQTRKASKILLEALGQKEAPIIVEDEVSALRLQEHDVLYLGVPEKGVWPPPVPKELIISPADFSLNGVRYDTLEDVLFVVLPHPLGGKGVVGLFLPLSADCITTVARKIPHYGKYSYLVFRSGVNQAKGTWSVSASPLTYVFTSLIKDKSL